MNKPIILGTAGHIDHGKTSLVRALTGIDTDRLKEEKARGITIELGFAHLTLPNGELVGIVDVPGHEKFVRHMVAGATGIDMVAMVIAADEGVMPQTREHMDICQLLGVRSGLIVLTKIDLADDEWRALVEDDVRAFVKGTFLEDAPLVHFSAADKTGIDEVLAVMAEVASSLEERQTGGLFRMPLDRVFTMRGFGTVVTGTPISGTLALGDTAQIFPGRLTAKIRGLEVHNEKVTEVTAGLRSAINLQGVDKADVSRGQVLAHEKSLLASRAMDVWLQYLNTNEKPLKNRSRIRFHTGTVEILGRALLLDAETLDPGRSGFAQIQLEEETAVLSGDRFVVRSYSPVRTIAGGEILHPRATRHKRFQEAVLKDLTTLHERDPMKSLDILIASAGHKGISAKELAGLIDLPAKTLKSALNTLLSSKTAQTFDKGNGRIVSSGVITGLNERVLKILKEYHQAFPLRPGLNKEELKTRVPALADNKLLAFILENLTGTKAVGVEQDIIHLFAHRPSLAKEHEEIENRLLQTYEKADLTPPYFKDVSRSLTGKADQQREVLELMLNKGVLVRVKDDLYFHHKALERLKKQIREYFEGSKELTTPQFKEMTGLTRKYLIPLLEYFDTQGLTMRLGDTRVLRGDS
ncbi:MAG: selenocysteine-specific translation elongation factor [Deltaproteobacteria bacterium]|nr:selenocysteine-specific translation elongation factor [Deltaproteobacteria bacterium]